MTSTLGTTRPFQDHKPGLLPVLNTLNPRRRLRSIRDPVYNYIVISKDPGSGTASEEDIMQSPWMQRLKRISQTQTAWASYPGATHTRFQHSLGVMHLAGKFARALYQPYHERFATDADPPPNYVEEVFRLAGWLHDIGHGPMSHAFDSEYSSLFSTNHEQIGREIVRTAFSPIIAEIGASLHGDCGGRVDPEHVLAVLYPPPEQDVPWWIRLLRPLISHPVFDVDKADYLMRDSLYTGTPEYGTIDWRGLFYRTCLTKTGIAYHRSSLGLLTSFCESRFRMYQHVYFHHRSQEVELSIAPTLVALGNTLIGGNPSDNLDKYLGVDDYCFDVTARQWVSSPAEANERHLGAAWADAFDGRPRWREVIRIAESTVGPALLPRVIQAIGGSNRIGLLKDSILADLGQEGIGLELKDTRLDVRPENPSGTIGGDHHLLHVFDDGDNSPKEKLACDILSDLPARYYVLGVFSDADGPTRTKLREICERRFLRVQPGTDQQTSY